MGTITVIFIYFTLYVVFLFASLPVTLLLVKRSREVAVSISPSLGASCFAIFSSFSMYYMTGRHAGQFSASLLIIISGGLAIVFCNKIKLQVSEILRIHLLGIIAGLFFLLPLLLLNESGIYALNGADFGSYAGWGSYFLDKTLLDCRPLTLGVNSTLAGFANLQQELASPYAAWRVGNVSFFAALHAFSSAVTWPTFYMSFIAFTIGQFCLIAKLFTRHVLLQPKMISRQVGWVCLLLNTVYWLGMSHYTPNLFGLSLTVCSLTIAFSAVIGTKAKVLLLGVFLAALLVMYPESLLFIFSLSVLLLTIKGAVFRKSHPVRRSCHMIMTMIIALVIAGALVCRPLPTVIRHLRGMLGYSRPGDFVGIHEWGYLSQLFGFADYNSLLRQYDNFIVHDITIICYVLFCAVLFIPTEEIRHKRVGLTTLRNRVNAAMVLACAVYALPITGYWLNKQLLLAWRSMLTLSPYIWIAACVSGFSALRQSNIFSSGNHERAMALIKPVNIKAIAFLLVLVIAAFFRIAMLNAVIFGSENALVFGKDFSQQLENVDTKKYDYVFIEYEGSGTVQAGWEFYAQNLPFIFPEHGSGRNEYDDKILRGRRVVIVGGGFPPVARLENFPQSGAGDSRSHLALYSDKDNIFIPYSSTWIYMQNAGKPLLILPGLPGRLLLWSQYDVHACLKIQAHANRPNAALAISINHGPEKTYSLAASGNFSECAKFSQGLNVVRIIPLDISAESLYARDALLRGILAKDRRDRSEYEKALINMYIKGFASKNPLSSARPEEWENSWNLITPEDKFPLNPYVIFNDIRLSAESSSNRDTIPFAQCLDSRDAEITTISEQKVCAK